MNGRAGKQARKLSQYRMRMRSDAQARAGKAEAMPRSLYYGSKCDKPSSERRPAKGGKVHS